MSQLDEKLLNRVKDELIKEGYLHIHGIEKFWPEVCRRYAEEVYRPDFELVDKHIGELEQKISQLKKQLEEAKELDDIKVKYYEDKCEANQRTIDELYNETVNLKTKLEVKEKPDFDNSLLKFLCGESDFLGLWFGFPDENGAKFWWRPYLRKEYELRDAAIIERDEKIKQLEEKIYGRQDGEMHDFGCQCFKCIISRFEREIERLKQSRIASIKASLEKAAEKGKCRGIHPSRKDIVSQKVIYPHHDGWEIKIDESSITDESNIVIVE